FQKRVNENIAEVYEENRNLGKLLYDILLLPVTPHLSKKDLLIIIPDGILHRLPFGALVTPGDQFFEQEFFWAKAPSVNILFQNKSAPFNSKKAESLKFLMVAGNLPSTNYQKSILSRVFNHLTILENEQATLTSLKSRLQELPDIVYFCIHAVADERNPMNSFIELFQKEPTNGSGSWGKIYARELLKLDFSNTWLTVLNACESSFGKIVRGEGILNLVRLFSLSRIPVIVASLWKNDDQKSAKIITHFFEEIGRNNQNAIKALNAAKKFNIAALQEEHGYALPYFWAPLEVYLNSLNHETLN
ncbi:MAG: CHAT domain-containing protein, partial [Calditrichaeota bacterium]